MTGELNDEDKMAARLMGISEDRAKEIKLGLSSKGITHLTCPNCHFSAWYMKGEKDIRCRICGKVMV